jgi:4-amino-4-deoxy-L-arabinose transferase-like glycosyltransferase
LLLAAGVKAGVPALVNPVFGAMCVIVIWRLGTALFGPRTGLLCALFCCVSPFFLFMSSEFMSHPAALLFTSLATLAYVSARSATDGLGGYATSGAAAGLAFLIRPADAAAIWAAQTVHGLWVDRSRRAVVGACLSAVPLACGAVVYLAYNRVLMGTWLSSPVLLVSPRNRMGFGADIGYDWAFETPGHTPWRAVLNLNHNAAVMSQDLFGWPITSLFFVLVLACFGRKDSRHGLCGLIIAAFVVLYGLYWYHGEAFGARFYFTLLPSLLMLTVEGIRQTPEILTRLMSSAVGTARLARLTATAVTLSFVFGWAVYMPKVSLISPYYNYKGVNNGFKEFQRRERLDDAIVFVQAPEPLYYGPAFIANDLPIGRAPVIYAIDRGDAANQALIDLFPGRIVRRFTHERRPNPVLIWLHAHSRDGW